MSIALTMFGNLRVIRSQAECIPHRTANRASL
jgi:hypothetical protein